MMVCVEVFYKWKCHVIVRHSDVFIQDSLYCALPIGLFLVECLGLPVAELELILRTDHLRSVKVPIPSLARERSESVSRSSVSDSLQPRDYSLPGCSVHGILQARMLEWARHSLLPNQNLPNPGVNWISCIAGMFFTI